MKKKQFHHEEAPCGPGLTRREAMWRGAVLAAGSLGWAGLAHAEAGVSDDEILIGQSCQLSGPLAPLSQELRLGAGLVFDQVNAQGGVHGRRIRVIAHDDAYDPQRAADNVRRLIEQDRVFALFNLSGTLTAHAALPFVKEHKVPLVAPFTGSDALRSEFNRHVFNVRAGYGDEIGKMVQHLSTLGMSRVAVAYLNNPFGKSALALAEAAAARYKVQLAVAAPLEVDGKALKESVQAIAAQRPHAVIMATAGRITSDFIGAYRAAGDGAAQFYALSVVSSQQLIRELGDRSRGIVIAQVMPYPWGSASRVARELGELAQKADVAELTYNHMDGFVSARVLVEGLRRAGRNLDREGFVRALESLSDFDLGGYKVRFSGSHRNGSSYVELSVVGASKRMMR